MSTLVCILTLSLVSVTRAGSSVPFHASIDTSVAVVGGTPTTLNLQISGIGQGSLVGRLEVDGPSQVNLVNATQTGTSTLTAADGSSFDFSFSEDKEAFVMFTKPETGTVDLADIAVREKK